MSKRVIPKTKEQLKDFINEIIAGKISTRGKTKHNEKRLKPATNLYSQSLGQKIPYKD